MMAEFEAPPNTRERARTLPNPLLKLALELGPLGVFFFANAPRRLARRAAAVSRRLGDPANPDSQGLFIRDRAVHRSDADLARGLADPDAAAADHAVRHRHRRAGVWRPRRSPCTTTSSSR